MCIDNNLNEKQEIETSKMSILDRDNISNDLVTFSELLSKCYFRIPDYQRGYAWSSEFIDLWEDILKLSKSQDNNRKHYTGMITLDQLNESDCDYESLSGMKSFYIVDGQQRFTSLVIMIKCILEFSLDNDIKEITSNLAYYNSLLIGDFGTYRFGYSTNRHDDMDSFFEKRVYQYKKQECINQYYINVDAAIKYMEKELNKFDNVKILNLLEIILNRLVFNLYFITDGFDVRVTFETMNNRGKPLSNLEILKNRLMYLSTYFYGEYKNYSNLLKKQINKAWKYIYDKLNYDNSILSDDEYLRAHWDVAYKLSKKNNHAYIDDLLNDYFAIDGGRFDQLCRNGSYKEAYDLISNYVNSLKDYSEYWSIVNNPREVGNIDSDEMERIKRLSRLPNYFYMKACLMVVLSENKTEKSRRILFYDELEKFAFIDKLLAQDKNDFSFLISATRALIYADVKDKNHYLDELRNTLQDRKFKLDKESICKAMTNFSAYINDKYSYYYDWNGLKYFLYEYDESFDIEGCEKIVWLKNKTASIEHVLPQSPKSIYWLTAFDGYLDEENARKIINSIGNLLLVSNNNANSSLSNYSYPVKCYIDEENKKYTYAGGAKSSRKLAENKYWTPKEVYDRCNLLFDFMHERWMKDFITIEEWHNLLKSLNLINFNYEPLTKENYNALIDKLDKIDVSEERHNIRKSLHPNNKIDQCFTQLKEYFDEEFFDLHKNSKYLNFNSDRYTCRFKSKNNIEPYELEIGNKINNIKYSFLYNYDKNELKIYRYDDKWNEITEDELSSDHQRFLRSFKRYIRKGLGKTI